MAKFSVEYYVEEDGKKTSKYSMGSDVDGTLSFAEMIKFVQKNLVFIADAALKEEQAKGFDKKPVTLVDGKRDRSPTQVKPFGTIEMIARASAGTVLLDMYSSILEKSPGDSGLYRLSNIVLFNGALVATNFPELKKFVAGQSFASNDIIRYVNLTPYASKLEREGTTSATRGRKRLGKSKDSKQRLGPRVRNPNGVYYQTFKAFKKKFKGNVLIFFDFLQGTALGNATLPVKDLRNRNLRTRFRDRNKLYKGPYVYPSIRVYITEGGTV